MRKLYLLLSYISLFDKIFELFAVPEFILYIPPYKSTTVWCSSFVSIGKFPSFIVMHEGYKFIVFVCQLVDSNFRTI